MKRWPLFIVLIGSGVAAAATTTQPGNSAASEDALPVIATPIPISENFALLNDRSPFVPWVQRERRSGGGRSGPSQVESAETRQQSNLVFNGVTVTDGKPVAFIEDMTEGRVYQYHVGDSIAGGKVAQITLDAVDYETNGRRTHVTIGENLQGASAWDMTYGVAPAMPSTQPTGQPSETSTGSGGSADSVLEKMRQRRLQELGGK